MRARRSGGIGERTRAVARDARRAGRRPSRIRGSHAGLALVLLAACLQLGCATTRRPPPAIPAAGAYRVGTPDKLTVSILPEPKIEREVTVRPDGKISMDLIGDVQASGRTPEQIAADIQTRIDRYKRDAHVTVFVDQSLSTQVTVMGEVRNPATFPLLRKTRVAAAIGRVGGPTLFASKDRVRIIRHGEGGSFVYPVDLDAIEDGDQRTNIVLENGDIVVVPPRTLAKIGYAMAAVLFPFQQLIGFGANVTTTVVTGGASAAAGL